MSITFESYSRRINQINECLAKYGIKDLEEARQIAGMELEIVIAVAEAFAAAHKDDPVDWRVDVLLDDVQRPRSTATTHRPVGRATIESACAHSRSVQLQGLQP